MTRHERIVPTETDSAAHLFPLHPSAFDWQVVIYGGVSARTGLDLMPLDFQFYKRTRIGGAGYSLAGIIERAEDMARSQGRERFAVRDTNGRIVARGGTTNG